MGEYNCESLVLFSTCMSFLHAIFFLMVKCFSTELLSPDYVVDT